jgi:hypothetical protein
LTGIFSVVIPKSLTAKGGLFCGIPILLPGVDISVLLLAGICLVRVFRERLIPSSPHQLSFSSEKDRLTLEEVGDYRIMRRKMEHCGLSLSDSKVTINVMLNLKRMGYNLTRVIDVYSTTVSTEMRLRNMKEECHQLEERLVAYRNRELTLARSWGYQQRALQDYGLMTQMGLNMGHILAATAVFCKHMNHFTINEILNEIDTYGNLRATNYRLARETDGLIQ